MNWSLERLKFVAAVTCTKLLLKNMFQMHSDRSLRGGRCFKMSVRTYDQENTDADTFKKTDFLDPESLVMYLF